MEQHRLAIQLTWQGALIYGAMLAYLIAFVLFVAKERAAGRGAYAAGFLLALAAFIYRWDYARHVPLQSMFEVFLCLGMLVYPLSVLYRRAFDIGGEAADALIGFIILFPAGFVFPTEPQHLPPPLRYWLFIPHVAAYMLAYVIMFKASTQAVGHLLTDPARKPEQSRRYEQASYSVVRLGFPLLTLGLILGAVWADQGWGRYWGWDPKELWSLTTWLVYLGYLHFRHLYGTRKPLVNSTLVLGGAVCVVLTLVWVNLSTAFAGGLHSYAAPPG
jgi:ABC-type transport system involved in cytochrome c biogenesis permease subunit